MFQVVQGTENSVELNYLNSLTEYQVAVFAIYRSSVSEALRGSATTRTYVWVRYQTHRETLHRSHNASSCCCRVKTPIVIILAA